MHSLAHALTSWQTVLWPVFISAVAWGIAVLASRQPDAESEIVLRLTRPAAGANSDRTPASGPLDAPHRGHRDGEA